MDDQHSMSKQHLLAAWGVTVTLAYVLTQILGRSGHSAVWPILGLWAVAMAVPLWMTWSARQQGADVGRLSALWVGLVVAAMAENALAAGFAGEAVTHVSYRTLWFAVGAVGFGLTAAWVEGGARKAAYAVWALANAAVVVGLLVAYESFEGWTFLLAAGVQGLPMLLDLPLRAHAERADG